MKVREFDQIFLNILSKLHLASCQNAKQSSESILEVSKQYVETDVHDSLNKFKDLYFNSKHMQEASDTINANVDDIFDQVQAALDSGENVEEKFDEVDQESENRMGISALQKKLESMVALDEGVRKKLVPIVTNMQIEEVLNHRITNLSKAWESLVSGVTDEDVDGDALSKKMAGAFSSQLEINDFYKMVREEEAPEGVEEQYTIYDVLF